VSLELTQLLLSSQPNTEDVDMHGDTPLLLAARCGAAHVAEALLKARADMNCQDGQRTTPLMLAARYDWWMTGCDTV
jgi:ankyrin repeat protein